MDRSIDEVCERFHLILIFSRNFYDSVQIIVVKMSDKIEMVGDLKFSVRIKPR